jgi:cystathionine gamma-lyase
MSPALLTTGSSSHLNGNTNGHTIGHSSKTNGDFHPVKPVAGFGTRAIHIGSEANAETGAVIPPISLSTTYKQDGVGNHKVGQGKIPRLLYFSFRFAGF